MFVNREIRGCFLTIGHVRRRDALGGWDEAVAIDWDARLDTAPRFRVEERRIPKDIWMNWPV